MMGCSRYVFAPAGNREARTDKILSAIEYIGSMQGGRGSKYAKGKRYLKSKIQGCSGAAIRKTAKIIKKLTHIEQDVCDGASYFYHEEMSVKILKEIIAYLEKTNMDLFYEYTGNMGTNLDLKEYLYGHRENRLRWTVANNFRGQGEKADKIVDALESV